MTDAAVIEKCQKLAALERGTNFEGEKRTAARMRKRLMKRHGLKARDVKQGREARDEGRVNEPAPNSTPFDYPPDENFFKWAETFFGEFLSASLQDLAREIRKRQRRQQRS